MVGKGDRGFSNIYDIYTQRGYVGSAAVGKRKKNQPPFKSLISPDGDQRGPPGPVSRNGGVRMQIPHMYAW